MKIKENMQVSSKGMHEDRLHKESVYKLKTIYR